MNYEKFPDKSADELRTMFPQMVFFDPFYDASIVGINLDENCVVYSESKIENTVHYELYYDRCREFNYRYLFDSLEGDISEIEFYKCEDERLEKIYDWFNQIKLPRIEGSLEPQLCYEPFEPRCTYIHKEPKIIDFDGDADDLPF
jgi:hypothetical protein